MTDSNTEEIKLEPENQEPEISVETENAPEAKATEAKGGTPEITPDDGIKELKARLEQEQIARAEAEKRARELQHQAHKAQNEVQDSNLQLIKSAIDSVQRTAQMLKHQYASALQSGAFDKAAELQEQISINSAKLLQLDNGRIALENQLANPPPPPEPADPVEQVAAQLSPRSAAWVRNHPQCITDKRLYQKMVGAHNIAVADGYSPDSDEYFEFIEQQMGFRKPAAATTEVEVDEPLSSASAPMQKRSAPPPAPSSRTASSSNSGRNVVRLTAEEREFAQMLGMSPEEYGKNKLALKREGKLN